MQLPSRELEQNCDIVDDRVNTRLVAKQLRVLIEHVSRTYRMNYVNYAHIEYESLKYNNATLFM